MNRGGEELCRARRGLGAQVHVWEERTVGAQMLRIGVAVTALPCAGLVPGRMKGPRLGPFEGAPSHPGGQLETMCCSLNP